MDQDFVITSQHVHAWLNDHPEDLQTLVNTHSSQKNTVISMADGELGLLRRQNYELQERLQEVISRLRRNEEIYQHFRKVRNRMILARNTASLILALAEGLQRDFKLEGVSISLDQHLKKLPVIKKAHKNPRCKNLLFFIAGRELKRTLPKDGRPVVRIGLEGTNRALFFGELASGIRSEVLTPLASEAFLPSLKDMGWPTPPGSLNLGGAMPTRFLPGYATDLLRDLADIFLLCLIRLIEADHG
ncbi:MAG: DUF484 family protein [Magnetococcales bacterium]|nr:DUF484 family protein [Magnetococcales bacterium]